MENKTLMSQTRDSAWGAVRDTSIEELRRHAHDLRRRMMRMATDKGEGYIAQGLGIADALAVVYFRELRYEPAEPEAPDRDRFVMSTGHYSIALYATLSAAGIIPE